jgi:hypothetical protein
MCRVPHDGSTFRRNDERHTASGCSELPTPGWGEGDQNLQVAAELSDSLLQPSGNPKDPAGPARSQQLIRKVDAVTKGA